jgi:hypothetical protein
MKDLVRSNSAISYVWLVLMMLTVVSWGAGVEERAGGHRTALVLTILTISVVKVRMVGLYFMELRNAPIPLRAIFEGYCLVLFGLLAGMFFLA